MQKLCCVCTRQHPLPVWSHKFVTSSLTHFSTNSRPFLVGIVSDNENQQLPENIPMVVEQENDNPPQFFCKLEHSSSCYHCLGGGRKNKVHLNFNNELSPTIQQHFEMFFLKFCCWNDWECNMPTFAAQ